MRAEELVALASAHGIDLQHAARVAAPRRPSSPLAPNGQRANGRQSYVTRPPLWSVAELGQAAAGVRRVPFLAACFSIAGDRSGYWELWQALTLRGFELRQQPIRNFWGELTGDYPGGNGDPAKAIKPAEWWKAWNAARDLRDEIVHRAPTVGQTEAEAAYEAAEKYIEHMRRVAEPKAGATPAA